MPRVSRALSTRRSLYTGCPHPPTRAAVGCRTSWENSTRMARASAPIPLGLRVGTGGRHLPAMVSRNSTLPCSMRPATAFLRAGPKLNNGCGLPPAPGCDRPIRNCCSFGDPRPGRRTSARSGLDPGSHAPRTLSGPNRAAPYLSILRCVTFSVLRRPERDLPRAAQARGWRQRYYAGNTRSEYGPVHGRNPP